jgi:translation initiation factor 5A
MAEGEKKPTTVKSLKPGSFVLVDDAPCKVEDLSISKPGKHGSAKARVTAIGIFDGIKRVFVNPADARADTPIIEKRGAQVIAKVGTDRVQIMDLETFETAEVMVPEGLEFKEGDEVLVWRYGNLMQIKSKK